MADVMKKLYYHPVNLTNHELKNPLSVIKDFFSNHALHEIREKTWQLFGIVSKTNPQTTHRIAQYFMKIAAFFWHFPGKQKPLQINDFQGFYTI